MKSRITLSLFLLLVSGCGQQFSSETSTSPKTQLAVYELLSNNETVKVIIRTNLQAKYYGKGEQSESERSARRLEFQDVKAKIVQAFAKDKNKIELRELKILNGFTTSVNRDQLHILENLPFVSKIKLDGIAKAILDKTVQEIGASDAWSTVNSSLQTLNGKGIKIAILDTGVDYTHSDLGGCFGPGCKVIGGYDFVHEDNDPMDDQGHGTHCAAIAAGVGIYPGVAPGAEMLAFKVLNNLGEGWFSDIIEGIEAAMDPNNDGDTSDHVDVISMSLGGYGDPDDEMSEAVNNATDIGVISAIAAGNSGPDLETIESPGGASSGITVAASCRSSQVGHQDYCDKYIASFSSRGPMIWNNTDLKKPDVAAPGVDICSARFAYAFEGHPSCLDGHHVRVSGTSMATPAVAGAIAILKQVNPNLTPSEIKDLLKSTANDLEGVSYNDEGAGQIDLRKALDSLNEFKPILEPISPNYWSVNVTKKAVSMNQDELRVGNSESSENEMGSQKKNGFPLATPLKMDPVIAGISDNVHLSIPNMYSKEFKVKGENLGLAQNLTIELDKNINGVTFSSDEDIVVSNNIEKTFYAMFIIDPFVVVPGTYARKILLKNSMNQIVGSIHVNLSIYAPILPLLTSPTPDLPIPTDFTGYLKTTTIEIPGLDLHYYDHILHWNYNPGPEFGNFWVEYRVRDINNEQLAFSTLTTTSSEYSFTKVDKYGGVCDYIGADHVDYRVQAWQAPSQNPYFQASDWTSTISVDCP